MIENGTALESGRYRLSGRCVRFAQILQPLFAPKRPQTKLFPLGFDDQLINCN